MSKARQSLTSPSGEVASSAANTARKPLRPAVFRKLALSNTITNIGIFMLWGAIPSILLPLQIQEIDAAGKVGDLALVLTAGALVAMIAQPVAGFISDRTRSRFGPRSPWMILGVTAGGFALVGIASVSSVVEILIAWAIAQLAYNFAQGPLSAILPDRVPTTSRGLFSALLGLGSLIGVFAGQIIAADFTGNIPAGYLLFAGITFVVVVIFVLINPDTSNTHQPQATFTLRQLIRSFWINPLAHPDFFWGFSGRLLLSIGFYLVSGYLLYILHDYIGLGDQAPGEVAVVGVFSLLGILIATPLGGILSDRIGRRKPIALVAGVLMATALLIPLVIPTLPGMYAYGLISGLGYGAYTSVDQALMSELLPSEQDYAKDLGVLNIAATMPQLLGPAVAGAIVLLSHGYSTLFPIGMVVALLGAIAVIPIKSLR